MRSIASGTRRVTLTSRARARNRPGRRQAVRRECIEGGLDVLEARLDQVLEDGEIVPLHGIVRREVDEVRELALDVAYEPAAIREVRRIAGQQVVAFRKLGRRQRAVCGSERGAHVLGVRDPRDGVCELDVGPIGEAAADDQQREGDAKADQGLDFDGRHGADLFSEGQVGAARRQEDPRAEQQEAGSGVDRQGRQHAIGHHLAGTPQIAEQRHACEGQDQDRAQFADHFETGVSNA